MIGFCNTNCAHLHMRNTAMHNKHIHTITQRKLHISHCLPVDSNMANVSRGCDNYLLAISSEVVVGLTLVHKLNGVQSILETLFLELSVN